MHIGHYAGNQSQSLPLEWQLLEWCLLVLFCVFLRGYFLSDLVIYDAEQNTQKKHQKPKTKNQ